MKIKFFVLFSLLLLIQYNPLSAATYYISNSGDDKNNGLSAVYPWKSIPLLNSKMSMLKPGDVILFERDGYFRGQINLTASGNDANPLIFSAYGEGKNPVISGSVSIQNLDHQKTNIYRSKVNSEVKNLFVNGTQMVLARYPNSGFLTIDQPLSDPKKGFTDNELKQSPGYWKGSVARIRTINWAFEYSKVQDYKNSSVVLAAPTYYPVQSGWGYYLDNNLNELDTAGEWYFKKNKSIGGYVYLYLQGNIDPDNFVIEGSVHNYGFYSSSNLKNIIIQNLNIRNQSVSGIWFAGSTQNVIIENCTFTGQLECGISLTNNSSNTKIDYNRFYSINGKAINLLNNRNSFISNNVLSNIGMIPGYGTTGDPFGMSGIIASGSSIQIFKNNIKYVGHDGINCLGDNHVIEKNVISNVLLYLNDGGGIKSYGYNSKNSEWRNNFVFNVPGNLNGTPVKENKISASGLYLDENCNRINITDNTVVNCGLAGINLFNGGKNNLFDGNTSYGNMVGIRFYQFDVPMAGNIVRNNIFFGLSKDQIAVRLKAKSGGFFPGVFQSNYYLNYSKESLFQYDIGNNIIEYNYPQWKDLNGQNSDVNSKIVSGNEIKYSKLFTNMTDDSVTVILTSDVMYSDLSLNSIYGSIVLQPWTSEILITGFDLSNKPQINASGAGLEFESTNGKNNNSAKWFNLSGNNLTDKVNVKAPDGFELSLSEDQKFTDQLTLIPENGKIDNVIFVRFSPDSEKGYYGFISVDLGSVKV